MDSPHAEGVLSVSKGADQSDFIRLSRCPVHAFRALFRSGLRPTVQRKQIFLIFQQYGTFHRSLFCQRAELLPEKNLLLRRRVSAAERILKQAQLIFQAQYAPYSFIQLLL